MTKATRKKLKYDSPPISVSFFCPSYRKGSTGFNTEIGNTTKRGLEYLSKLNKYVPTHAVFCDNVLEQMNQLTWHDFDDLYRCQDSFFSYAQDLGIDYISSLSTEIDMPVAGVRGEIPEKYFKGLMEREEKFYGQVFQWSYHQILDRLEVLAGSYAIMGQWVKDQNGFIVMIENQYERGKLYNCPIVYPKKGA